MKKDTWIKVITISVLISFLLTACSEPTNQFEASPPAANEPIEQNETSPTATDEPTIEYTPTQAATSLPEASNEVKNIILMIGDGMGAEQRKAAMWYSNGMTQKLVMDELPTNGWSRTAALDDPITDSPASGTAMATGSKTYKGRVSVFPDDTALKTILEYAQEQGMSVGLVSTNFITDATPAVFAAHVIDRKMRNEIAPMILDHQVDVLLGGGEDDFLPTSETGCYPEAGHRYDGLNLIDEAVAGGYTYICDASGLDGIEPGGTEKLLGLFGDEEMERPYSPTLTDMTETAINILSKNPDGFFLMVEGGLIDWACHANNAQDAINDTLSFEEAVTHAAAYAESTGDTLVIVTADHETGGMSVDLNSSGSLDEDGPFSMPDGKSFYINWTTDYHTAADVPVSAMGPGSEALSGTYQNTHIFDVMFSALPNNMPVAAATATQESAELPEDQPPSQFPETVTEVLNGVSFEFHDGFETLTENWYLFENATVSDEKVMITAQGNWESYWTNDYELTEGMASLLLFKFSENADFTLGHKIGDFGTPDYFFRGINEDTDRFVMQGEASSYDAFTGSLSMLPDTWYYGLFAIGQDGEYLIRVWEAADPANWSQNRYNFGDDWAYKGWWLNLALGNGIFSIDEFYSFSFSTYP